MGKKSVSTDIKKNIIVLRDMGISQHEISHRLKILRRCIRQTFSQFHSVAKKPSVGRPPKGIDREKRLIKLQQLRGDTGSLADLVRYINANLNLSIGRSTIEDYNMVSHIVSRKPRITPTQRRNRLTWCYDHLNWSINDWSSVIFSDKSNLEVLNRVSIRRFRNDRTRFERSQKRVHKDDGKGLCSYITCDALRPLFVFDGRLNSIKYIDLLETYLLTAFQKYPPAQLPKISYQDDNARPYVSILTKNY